MSFDLYSGTFYPSLREQPLENIFSELEAAMQVVAERARNAEQEVTRAIHLVSMHDRQIAGLDGQLAEERQIKISQEAEKAVNRLHRVTPLQLTFGFTPRRLICPAA